MTTPAPDFFWKRHDTAPVIQCQLQNEDGVGVNITGSTVKFIMRAEGSSVPKVTGTAVLVTPATGVVSYQPISADTDTAGTFDAEWEVTYTSGKKQTFPDPGYLSVLITADLDDA